MREADRRRRHARAALLQHVAAYRWRFVPESTIRRKTPCEASRSTEGALRIFPSFSWNGKSDSRERSESEHRRCVASTALLQHVPFCHRLCLARQNR